MERRLAAIESRLERDGRSLATIESRIELIQAELRRTAVTVSRIKLMLDNAKRAAIRHDEALQRLVALLGDTGGEAARGAFSRFESEPKSG